MDSWIDVILPVSKASWEGSASSLQDLASKRPKTPSREGVPSGPRALHLRFYVSPCDNYQVTSDGYVSGKAVLPGSQPASIQLSHLHGAGPIRAAFWVGKQEAPSCLHDYLLYVLTLNGVAIRYDMTDLTASYQWLRPESGASITCADLSEPVGSGERLLLVGWSDSTLMLFSVEDDVRFVRYLSANFRRSGEVASAISWVFAHEGLALVGGRGNVRLVRCKVAKGETRGASWIISAQDSSNAGGTGEVRIRHQHLPNKKALGIRNRDRAMGTNIALDDSPEYEDVVVLPSLAEDFPSSAELVWPEAYSGFVTHFYTKTISSGAVCIYGTSSGFVGVILVPMESDPSSVQLETLTNISWCMSGFISCLRGWEGAKGHSSIVFFASSDGSLRCLHIDLKGEVRAIAGSLLPFQSRTEPVLGIRCVKPRADMPQFRIQSIWSAAQIHVSVDKLTLTGRKCDVKAVPPHESGFLDTGGGHAFSAAATSNVVAVTSGRGARLDIFRILRLRISEDDEFVEGPKELLTSETIIRRIVNARGQHGSHVARRLIQISAMRSGCHVPDADIGVEALIMETNRALGMRSDDDEGRSEQEEEYSRSLGWGLDGTDISSDGQDLVVWSRTDESQFDILKINGNRGSSPSVSLAPLDETFRKAIKQVQAARWLISEAGCLLVLAITTKFVKLQSNESDVSDIEECMETIAPGRHLFVLAENNGAFGVRSAASFERQPMVLAISQGEKTGDATPIGFWTAEGGKINMLLTADGNLRVGTKGIAAQGVTACRFGPNFRMDKCWEQLPPQGTAGFRFKISPNQPIN